MASKLTNVQRNSKSYWGQLNRFLNNKKVPFIPPLFHGNKFVAKWQNVKEKAEFKKKKKTAANSLPIFII